MNDRKCKQCLEYFECDDYSDFCSERCRQEYEYAYEDTYDDWDNNNADVEWEELH